MKEQLKASDIPFIRSQNNYDTKAVSDATGLECKDPSLTQQQFADEANVNFIAERYGLTGEMPTVLNLPRYGDFTNIMDFQTAQDALVKARNDFMQLPAKLRSRFQNDPQQLLQFLEDPDNRDEAIALKLVNPPQNLPQSPQGDPAAKGKGDTPSPAPKAPETAPKGAGKDT